MSNIDFNRLMQSAGMAIAQSREALAIAQQMGGDHAAIKQELMAQKASNEALAAALSRVQVQRRVGDPHIQRIENIPGRRIPFDLLVDIPIGNNISATQQGTITVSQEGPFVAVARFATFLSTYQFQVRDPETGGAPATFQGRSFGRYRPISSVFDLNDGQPYSEVSQLVAFPGTGAPHVASPSNESPFRSMETDLRILFTNAGSSFPRSNQEVPSTFWAKHIADPFELGALDVFERGEVLAFNVLPLHVNNPPFGNIQQFGAPNPAYPFLESGWDAVEGINDQNDPAAADADPVTRLANGILTIGFHGYRIVQQPGVAGY
jgi:hypothetical protein